ncbi:MAG: polysaccharide biosynthesis tyrosine autokinase [Verrucomicrobia bacterium]|nr:polysaccharide biosynthesis tyrosine autokinase [Verrucomicrobiota bacterium]
MNSTQPRSLEPSFASDFRGALALLREKAWLLILCVLAGTSAGALYLAYSPRRYATQAVVQAVMPTEQDEQKVLKADNGDTQEVKGEEIAKNTEQSLTSPELLLNLIESAELNKDHAFLPNLKRPVSNSKMVEELAKCISTQVRRGTRLIDIRVEDQSPVMAQKIADLLIKEYINENFKRHIEASQTAYNFLLQQAERLKARLAKSEDELQAYKEQHGAVALGEKDNIVVDNLLELNRMATAAKGTRLKLEADYGQIRNLGNGTPTALLAVPAIASSPGVIELQKTITQKEAEVATLTQMYKAGHPIHNAALKQLQELKAGLDRMILKAADEVTSAYESAGTTEKRLQEALEDQEKKALAQNKTAISYKVLHQEVESNRALYESVLTRMKETDLTKSVARDVIRVISHPLLPEQPIWPSKSRVMLLGVFGGFALGGGLLLLTSVLDGSLKTVDLAERQLGLSVLGAIPRCGRPKWLTDDLLLIERPGSVTAESFRSLRASLSLIGKNAGHKVFLFTSAVKAEGKSFCAINCAVAFAQQGLKTLLIDADLRSPSMEGIFFGRTAVPGLSDAITGDVDPDAAVRMTNIHKLSLLCAGTQLDTPAELLAGEAFGQLVKQMAAQFDRVVIDSTPVEPVSDTLLLVGHVHATCLVVSTRTSAELVGQTIRKLRNADSTLVGFIFNGVSGRGGAGHSYRVYRSADDRARAESGQRPPQPSLPSPGPVLQES